MVEVDLGNLALAGQVLERQAQHSRATAQHLRQYGTLDAEDMGLILQLLLPINDALLDVADQALSLSAQVFDAGTQRMERTRQEYRESASTVAAAHRQFDGALGQLQAGMRVLVSRWSGHAQQAFLGSYGAWSNDMAEVCVVLREASEAAAHICEYYQAADERVANLWGL